MNIRRYLKDAFFADQAGSLLRRIILARQAAGGRAHGEALHDWRVLVRRLIEFTRLWAPRSLRRALLPLATPWIDATNPARDAEVEVTMLAALRQEAQRGGLPDLDKMEKAGQALLHQEAERLAAFLADPERAEEERRLAALLQPLPRYPLTPRRLPKRLKKSIARFHSRLDTPASDVDALHELRLAAKSVRYGFEPLAPLDPHLKPVLGELTALQRALGEHRDWQRLAAKSRQSALSADLVAAMEARAAAALATRPHPLKETEKWLDKGWTSPSLAPRMLRRRLLGGVSEDEIRAPLKEALTLATRSLRGRKRPAGASALVHPLRAALSLLEEGGRQDARLLVATLLSETLADSPEITEDTLAEQFGNQIVGAALALTPEPESAAEQGARLKAAPAWVRLIALAHELESLRFLAEQRRPRKAPPEALERARALLPLFRALRQPGAHHLVGQLERLLALFPPAE